MEEHILIFIICIVGAIVQGMSGFGYALTVMLFLPLVIPLELASLVVSMQNIIASGYSMYRYRRHIEYKTAAVPVIASVVLTPLGVYILLFSDQAVLKEILGYTILLLSIITYINSKKAIKVNPTIKNGVAAGGLSGILGGMFGTGGPPLVIYYLYGVPEKESYKATLDFSFFVRAVISVILHGFHGNVNVQTMGYATSGGLGTLLGTLVGLAIFERINQATLKSMISMIMVALGLLFIIGK